MSNFYPSPEQQEQIKESAEERRCDLCQDEKDLPCIGKDCHSPDLKGFKPKGEEAEDTGCETCSQWAAVKIGAFCPDCGQAL